jgi:6-phosphogluconolactonase/glucosamine-6-phosphate isomerase/deaminase
MPESRISIGVAELAQNIAIWLKVLGQRRAAVVRDIWTRRGEEYDAARIEHARHALARYLAEKILYAHELTRSARGQELDPEEYRPNGRAGDG